MAHDVFISYSSKDKPVTDGICANLEVAGIRCWMAPRDIGAGEDWPTAITKAISRSHIMVLVFSAYSNASDDVRRELILAVKNKLVIIPFKIENIEPEPGKQYYLESTHWLDAMNPPTQEQINTLLGRVKAILAVPEKDPVDETQPAPPAHLDPPETLNKPPGAVPAARTNLRKVIEINQKSLESAREKGDRTSEGATLSKLGSAYFSLGDNPKAIEFHEKALSIACEIGDRGGEGAALGNLGLAFADQVNARKAIEYFQKALIIAREIGNQAGEGTILGNMGIAFAAIDEPRKAIEFYEQALIIDREIGNRSSEGADLGNLGIAYAAVGDASKAAEFYEKRMEIAREINDSAGEGNALSYLGNTLYQKGKKENGIGLMKQALAIYEKIESPSAEWAREKLKEWGVEE